MTVLATFSGTFCQAETLVQRFSDETGLRVFRDQDMVSRASRLSGMDESKISKAFAAKTSVFNKFTHEKERSVAYLRLATAETLEAESFVVHGFCSLLIPGGISHVLRVCLIADMKSRIALAERERGVSEKEAAKLIRREDEDRIGWVETLHGKKDPWDSSLYDVVLPTDKGSMEEATRLLRQTMAKDLLQATAASRNAVTDFLLAARVEVALAKEGHNVAVSARAGHLTLTINRHVLLLSRLEEELKAIVQTVPGVEAVETRVGEAFYQTDIYRKFDFQAPSKVLLVDDEREFVQTLSERLLMRDMGSAVAYDGESALDLIREDEPEVMILDLKMPGIDGIEVLRRVKDSRPEIEVIILTGHGTEKDRKVCMDLGAFAYLQKPVDIDLLTQTLRRANEKIQNKRIG
jgi:two-component system, OmpR family, response regulator CpxR